MQAEEDKANRLSKLKIKLEGQIAEAHDELEREKKVKAELEKVHRKLEGDLKTTQEQLELLNHSKQELEKNVARCIAYLLFIAKNCTQSSRHK